MKNLLTRIDKNDALFIVFCIIVFLAFIGGALGSEWCKTVFETSFIGVPVYLGIAK